jgi:hypothetical protein
MTILGILGAPTNYAGSIVSPFGTIQTIVVVGPDFSGELKFTLDLFTELSVDMNLYTTIDTTLNLEEGTTL